MAVKDTWEPSESDIAWVSNLMRIMKDGSSWGMPMNGTVYKIDHKNKRNVLPRLGTRLWSSYENL